jgi:hypothetical protein
MKNLSLFLLCVVAISFAACDAAETPTLDAGQTRIIPQESTDVLFDTCDIPNESVRHLFEGLEMHAGKLIVIDNEAELREIVTGDCPAIDFSAKTLLLAYGADTHGIGLDRVNFRKIADNGYCMCVDFQEYATAVMSYWTVAIVVDKLAEGSDVRLNVIESCYPNNTPCADRVCDETCAGTGCPYGDETCDDKPCGNAPRDGNGHNGGGEHKGGNGHHRGRM